MAAWKPWSSYDEVPVHVLSYIYNDKAKITARDLAYLDVLNRTFNPMPMRMRAATEEGVKCFLCSIKLIPAQAEKGRLCRACEKEVERKGEVKLGHGWSISVA